MSAFHFPALGVVGLRLNGSAVGNPVAMTWPAANRAIYIPFELSSALAVQRLMICNNFAPAGTVDLGVYSLAGVRLVSTGALARVGGSLNQHYAAAVNLTGPGWYYIGAVCTSVAVGITAGVQMSSAADAQSRGVKQENVGGPTLPANMTPVAITTAVIPNLGLCTSATL